MWRRVLACCAGTFALLLGGCGAEGAADYRPEFAAADSGGPNELTFAVHPLHNPQLLAETYGPLVDLLNRRLPGIRLRLVASNSYGAFEERLKRGEFDFALPNPVQSLKAESDGYEIFGKMAGDDGFRGIILVRRDSGVRSLEDLRGKTISYPAPTALAATLLPQQYLHDHGLGVGATRAVYVGSQESSIDSVYRGYTAASATWPMPWIAYAKAHPAVAAALEVKWRTDPLVNNGLVVRRDLAPNVRRAVADALFDLDRSAEGRAVLERIGVSAFEPANTRTYAAVARFMARFGAERGEPAAEGESR